MTCADDNSAYLAEMLVQLAFAEFALEEAVFKKINDNKSIRVEQLQETLQKSIAEKKCNPFVLAIILGKFSSKYCAFAKAFIKEFAHARGYEDAEYIAYFGAYLLFNGADELALYNCNISSRLCAFVRGNIGRVPTIMYIAIIFVYIFLFVLVSQMYEVHLRFASSEVEQQKKLIKLYSASERLALLVANAISIASKKVQAFGIDAEKVRLAFEKMLDKNKSILVATDLFSMQYRF